MRALQCIVVLCAYSIINCILVPPRLVGKNKHQKYTYYDELKVCSPLTYQPYERIILSAFHSIQVVEFS